MAEAVEQPEFTGEQSTGTLPEKPQEALLKETVDEDEALLQEPSKVTGEPSAASPVPPDPPPKTTRPKRSSAKKVVSASKPGARSAQPSARPEKKPNEERKPRNWTAIVNAMILITNLAILYPAWKAANAEREQADLAKKEAEAALEQAKLLKREFDAFRTELAGGIARVSNTLGLPEDERKYFPPPPVDLKLVPQSFNCSVQEGEGRLKLVNSEICYELRFDIQNNGAGDRRVRAWAEFSREGRSWTCRSDWKTVAFERSDQFSIPVMSCFDENQERRNGDLAFSLKMESIPE